MFATSKQGLIGAHLFKCSPTASSKNRKFPLRGPVMPERRTMSTSKLNISASSTSRDNSHPSNDAKFNKLERSLKETDKRNYSDEEIEPLFPTKKEAGVTSLSPGSEVQETNHFSLEVDLDSNAGNDGASSFTVPRRWLMAIAMSLSFVLCNMDKVNMSVAVIPMAKEFGWTASDKGLVSSAFFWGYAATQVPGGWLANKVGGVKVLGAAVVLWSLGTLLTPAAAYLPQAAMAGICAARLMVGLGEGMAPPSSTGVMAKIFPPTERSRAVALTFGGMDVGNVVGLLVAPVLIHEFGWPSVFWVFALLGFGWVVLWAFIADDELRHEDEMVEEEKRLEEEANRARLERGGNLETVSLSIGHKSDEREQNDEDEEPIPWAEFRSSRPMWAITTAHFCHNWGYYTLLAWLPSYFEGALGQNLQSSTYLSLLPYLAMALMNPVVGTVGDKLLTSEVMSITQVRKSAQGIAFLVPAACNLILATITPISGELDPSGALPHPLALYVSLFALAFAGTSCSRAGLYCNHQDISPKYASVLLGITNTAGAFPGLLGVWFAGVLLDSTDSWAAAIFLPSILCQVIGAAVYFKFASGEKQAWG